MNCASARCSRARSPRRNEKRAPETLAAVAKSSSPSASPTSVWSFGAKPKVRGVPQRRTSTLSDSERPTGVDAWVRLGRSSRKSRSPRWTRSSSPSRRFVSSPMPATSARIADASSPRPFSAPICFDSALRFACRSCVRVWMSRRSSSSAVKRPASSVTPRLASPAATPARSVRRRLISSIRIILSEACAAASSRRPTCLRRDGTALHDGQRERGTGAVRAPGPRSRPRRLICVKRIRTRPGPAGGAAVSLIHLVARHGGDGEAPGQRDDAPKTLEEKPHAGHRYPVVRTPGD